jgi:hypothetical protein
MFHSEELDDDKCWFSANLIDAANVQELVLFCIFICIDVCIIVKICSNFRQIRMWERVHH